MPLRSASEVLIKPDPEALEGTNQDCRPKRPARAHRSLICWSRATGNWRARTLGCIAEWRIICSALALPSTTSRIPRLRELRTRKPCWAGGSFLQQSAASLKRLCKTHRIKGYSKLQKAALAQLLERHGVPPPPPPLESFSKKELIALVRKLLGEG